MAETMTINGISNFKPSKPNIPLDITSTGIQRVGAHISRPLVPKERAYTLFD